jgi:hypothetical protein
MRKIGQNLQRMFQMSDESKPKLLRRKMMPMRIRISPPVEPL